MLAPLRFLLLLTYLLLPLVTTHAQPVQAPSVISLPFDQVGGVIVVRNLSLNGRRGDFLLDTGCSPALVVEEAAFTRALRPSADRALTAGGARSLHELTITQFDFAPAYTPATAPALSLAALRAAVSPRLLGLIGTGLLRHYEVVLDYAHHRLSCYPLGSSGARPFVRADSVAFTLPKGAPVAVAFIDSVPVQLLLDTGAQENHLDADFAQHLTAGTRPRKTIRETLLTPNSRVPAIRAMLPQLQVGTTRWENLPVVLAPPVHYASGRALPYQGVLGNDFFRQDQLVSFHYGRQKFYSLHPLAKGK